jgi:hypothetical protein
MNKQELVEAVAAKTGDSKVATGETIDAVIAAITGELTPRARAPHGSVAIQRLAPRSRSLPRRRSSSLRARPSRMQ